MPAAKTSAQAKATPGKSNLNKMLKFDVQNYHKVRELFDLPALSPLAGKANKSAPAPGLQLTLLKELDVIIGVDEVGRGCLAGPVVSAAVLLPLTRLHPSLLKSLSELDDSKKLKADVRERISDVVRASCPYAIGMATPREIDEINILQASLLSMRRAIAALSEQVGIQKALVLVDGNKQIKEIPFAQLTVIKGDSQSASIAAASVVAKVHRDSLMRELALQYPVYGFDSHKGYPSISHRKAIAEHGHCDQHRLSFRLLADVEEEIDDASLELEQV